MDDTIAAISTPLAPGGIGIVRISGENAFEIADRIFQAKRGKKLDSLAAYTAAYGKVGKENSVIDECIALVFHSPKSYTGENVVELSCHGGVYIMKKVLEAAISAGARLAEPGEFTKRAFLNGKLDFTQAESVMDLINANGAAATNAAIAQHEGALYRKITKLKSKLVEISAAIAAWIDFPEEGVPELDPAALVSQLTEYRKLLQKYISSYEQGKIIREGIDTVIVGKPNSGKSTLMNLLSGTEKSIVTEIPGTTRDVIEENVRLGDVILHLADTAGIRDTEEAVEKIGVNRALSKLKTAELVLALFDASRPLDHEDEELIDLIKGKPAVAVLNKTDLPEKIEWNRVRDHISHIVRISAVNGQGIEELERKITELVGIKNLDLSAGLLANERQLQCANKALRAVQRAEEAVRSGITLDAVSVEIDAGINALCELTGEKASDMIIDHVFSNFCVGK